MSGAIIAERSSLAFLTESSIGSGRHQPTHGAQFNVRRGWQSVEADALYTYRDVRPLKKPPACTGSLVVDALAA
jgi:hypothetical protein